MRGASKRNQSNQQNIDREGGQSRSRSRSRDRKAGRPSKKALAQQSSPSKPRRQEENEESGESNDLNMLEEGDVEGPESIMIDAFIDFFYAVGQEKGMVLSDSDRKDLIKKAEKRPQLATIKWTDSHEWQETTEREKLESKGLQYGIDFKDSKYSRFYEMLMKIGWIFAQQFTSEIYDVFIRIFLMIQQPLKKEAFPEQQEQGTEESMRNQGRVELDERLKQLANEMCHNTSGKYYLVSFQFDSHLQRQSNKKRKIVEPHEKLAGYQKLVKQIYMALKAQEETSQ